MKIFKKNINLKKKKKGVTLIELVAVLAIIAILAATFVPKFTNYITEAKKVAVLNEAKSVVTAYEASSHKIDTIETSTTVAQLCTTGMPLHGVTLEKIPTTLYISQCKDILNGKFTLSSSGELETINDTPISKISS